MQIRTLDQLTGSWGLVIQLQSNGSCCCLSNRLTKEDLDFFNLDQICLFSGKKKSMISMVRGTAKPILYKFSPSSRRGDQSLAGEWMDEVSHKISDLKVKTL